MLPFDHSASQTRGSQPVAALLLAAVLAFLDWSYYHQANALLGLGSTREKAELFCILFADAYFVLGFLALLALWRPSRGWFALLCVYLVFRALDRVAVARCYMHLFALAKFAPMVIHDPASLQWVGGIDGVLALLVRAGLYAVGLIGLCLLLGRLRLPQLSSAVVVAVLGLLAILPVLAPDALLQKSAPHLHALFVGKARTSVTPELQREMASFEHGLDRAICTGARLPTRLPATSAPPNILIIIGESWNATAIPQLSTELAPYLKLGFVSRAHYSSSNSSTLGLFSILSGRDALLAQSDVTSSRPILLPALLKQAGFQTHYFGCAGFWAVDGQSVLLHNCHFDEVSMGDDNASAWPQRDHEILQAATAITKKTDGPPKCAIVFTGCTHYPYRYPAEWQSEMPCAIDIADKPAMVRRYRNSARYSLHEIAEAVRLVDLSHTVVVIVGDHGESLGEDGSFGHLNRASEAQCRTCFWMLGAGLSRDGHLASASAASLTRHVDILPTLLHAVFGRAVPCPGTQGRDLLDSGSLCPAVAVCTPFSRYGEPQQLVLLAGKRSLRLQRPDPQAARLVLDAVCDTTTDEVRSRQIDNSWLPILQEVVNAWSH